MIVTVKNQGDAYGLADEFARWLNDVLEINCPSHQIVVTSDTVQDFVDACQEIDGFAEVCTFPPDFATLKGGAVTELEGAVHPARGRCDVFILDTGDYRLVFIC